MGTEAEAPSAWQIVRNALDSEGSKVIYDSAAGRVEYCPNNSMCEGTPDHQPDCWLGQAERLIPTCDTPEPPDLAPAGELVSRATIDEVIAERQRQNEQWGGQEHDDEHAAYEWFEYILKQWGYGKDASNKIDTLPDARARLVKIAALAVAGIESMDRRYFGKESPALPRVARVPEFKCEHGVLLSMECLACAPEECEVARIPQPARALAEEIAANINDAPAVMDELPDEAALADWLERVILKHCGDVNTRAAAEEIALNIAYLEDKAAQESIVDDLERIIESHCGVARVPVIENKD